MEIRIIAFGPILEEIKEPFLLENIGDTDQLKSVLHQRFPVLEKTRYLMAVNKKTITGNTVLTDKSVVALLPAFSGG